MAILALGLSGCDRLAQQWPYRWPLRAEPSSVTIKLPPPRTASPGFTFENGGKAPQAALREGDQQG
jgi:hypothetical protein